MIKPRIGLLGKALKKEDLLHLTKIETALIKKRPDIEVISIRKEAVKFSKNSKMDYMDKLFELTVDIIDRVDLVLVIEPVNPDLSGAGYMSWVLGYSWSNGVCVGILTDQSETAHISHVPVATMQAHFTNLQSLLQYDFEERPFIPFKGIVD